MERWGAIAATVVAGGAIAFQPVFNSALGRETGALGSALIGFASGTLVLLLAVVLAGDLGRLGGLSEVRWYYLLGGLTGVVIVTVSLVTVRELGAGGVVAATICGQLTLSVVLDRLGVFGLEKVGLTPARVIGVVLLFTGTYLLTR